MHAAEGGCSIIGDACKSPHEQRLLAKIFYVFFILIVEIGVLDMTGASKGTINSGPKVRRVIKASSVHQVKVP
jgi:hypothetical protein